MTLYPLITELKPPLPTEKNVSPKRPGYGTKGRDIQLQANFFELKLPKGDIHHYDVTIIPDKCPRAVNHAVVQTMVDQYHKMFGGQKPVFDGRKNLYSRNPLPIDKEKVGLVLKQFHFKIENTFLKCYLF